jgi:hypothetical protein
MAEAKDDEEAHCFICFGERVETESGDQFWECSVCSCRVHLECQRKYDAVRPNKPTGWRWGPVLCPNKHPLKRELQVRAPVDWRGDWQWRMNASWKGFLLLMLLVLPLQSLCEWSKIKTFASLVTWIVETIVIQLTSVGFSHRSVNIAFSYFEAGVNSINLLIWFSLLSVKVWTTLRVCFSFTIPRRVLYKWDK